MLDIKIKKQLLPVQTLDQAKRLVQFDYDNALYWILLFNFGDDGGALGIWKEGDDFCARLSLDTLADFNRRAKADYTSGHG